MAMSIKDEDTDDEEGDTDVADLAALNADPIAYLNNDRIDAICATSDEDGTECPTIFGKPVNRIHMSMSAPATPPTPPATSSAIPDTRPTHLP